MVLPCRTFRQRTNFYGNMKSYFTKEITAPHLFFFLQKSHLDISFGSSVIQTYRKCDSFPSQSFSSDAEYGTGDRIQKLFPAWEMCSYKKEIFNSHYAHGITMSIKHQKMNCFIKWKHLRKVHGQGELQELALGGSGDDIYKE